MACDNGREYIRQLSLASDDYIRRDFGQSGIDAATVTAAFHASPEPKPEDEWLRLVEISDVRMLEDGRIAAVVVFAGPIINPLLPEPGPAHTRLDVLVQIDGTWVLDDRASNTGPL